MSNDKADGWVIRRHNKEVEVLSEDSPLVFQTEAQAKKELDFIENFLAQRGVTGGTGNFISPVRLQFLDEPKGEA